MHLERVLAAVDNSPAGREAARSAARIAAKSGAELTVFSVAPGAGSPGAGEHTPLDLVETSLGRDFFADFPSLQVELAGGYGLPQIEIGRYAEHRKADLIVMGRKPRSRATRLFLGDTADAVLRRSRIPCLMVPPDLAGFSRMTVALDGTDRGFMVYDYACDFAAACCMQLTAVTVEPRWSGEPPGLSAQVWSARAERLLTLIEQRQRKVRKSGAAADVCVLAEPLHVRNGEVVEEMVVEVTQTAADVLVLGFHRGGPPLVVATGSASRKLVHAAPCAVLTVPF